LLFEGELLVVVVGGVLTEEFGSVQGLLGWTCQRRHACIIDLHRLVLVRLLLPIKLLVRHVVRRHEPLVAFFLLEQRVVVEGGISYVLGSAKLGEELLNFTGLLRPVAARVNGKSRLVAALEAGPLGNIWDVRVLLLQA